MEEQVVTSAQQVFTYYGVWMGLLILGGGALVAGYFAWTEKKGH